MYHLTFCAWLIVAASINVVFTDSMLLIFCFFCMLSTAIIILHTTKKPQQQSHAFRYYRDFILFSTLLVVMTTGLFYGISKSIVLMDSVFMNLVSDYIMPRHYTHFLNISPRLYLNSPGRSAWDRRPVLEITIPRGDKAYLKTQVFEKYHDGTWIEPENSRQKALPETLIKKLPQGEMTMFTSIENIIPSPSTIVAAAGNTIYTKSEDGVLFTKDKQRTRIFKFSLAAQNPSIELTQDKLNTYTRLPPGIARELKELSADIIGGETDARAKAVLIRDFFQENFKYSLNVNFQANDKGILKMIREKRQAYCTYFASAMTLLLRAENIPSRVAAGFLVTENIDKRKNKFLVRVNNAHAWTEVLLPQNDHEAGRSTNYTWKTFDATPAGELNDALSKEEIYFRALTDKIWLTLLRFNALIENADKEKLKVNFLKILVCIMVFINHKKIFTGLYNLAHRLMRKIPLRLQKPNKLQSIYRRYEYYLKMAFNEKRERADTDREVIERLKGRRDIPGETIAKVESFLGHYHAARFGEKESVHLEKMIASMGGKKYQKIKRNADAQF